MPSDEQIVRFFRDRYLMEVGARTVAQLRDLVGSPTVSDGDRTEVRGRDLVAGLPTTTAVTVGELRREQP